jgi:hypothetical protein
MRVGTNLGPVAAKARRGVVRGMHSHVNIFKDLAGSDAAGTIRALDQVISHDPGVLATERVFESHGFAELPGFHQKTSAINVPVSLAHVLHPGLTLENRSESRSSGEAGQVLRITTHGGSRRRSRLDFVRCDAESTSEFV